jgi:hypothetical protein
VSFDSLLLCIALVGEVVVCALLWKRGLWRILPFFALYTIWCFISDGTGALILSKYSTSSVIYHRYYYTQIILDALLQFAVLGELAWSVLRPVRNSLPRGSRFVLYVLIAIAGAAIWPLAAMTVPSNLAGADATLFHVAETFAILRVVCFLIMASFSQLLSIGWRDRELQVATGLGLYSIVSLLVTVLHSHMPSGTEYNLLNQVQSASYAAAILYWLVSFATKEQERKEFSPQMQQLLVLMGGGARSGRIALGELPPEPSRKRIK